MNQLKIVLQRLKNPAVITSLVSEFIAILMLLNIDVDANMIAGIIATITSMLVMLGILSNPDTETKGFGDDIAVCSGCGEETQHVLVGGELVCQNCGHRLESE